MCWREAFYIFQRLGICRGKRNKTFFGEKGGFNMKSWRQLGAGSGSCKIDRTCQWGWDFDQKLIEVG